jgi:hypothetical protein
MAMVPFSRKCTQQEKRDAVKFFQSVKDEEFDWNNSKDISLEAKKCIATVIDEKCCKAYQEILTIMKNTDEHKANYQELIATHPNCGRFSKKTAILSEATPFEQMVAVSNWVDKKKNLWLKRNRTICLSVGDEFVPVYILNARKKITASLMTVRLGSARGSLKAPFYTDFAKEDDEKVSKSIFLKPLEFLEDVRQPEFLGSTLLKANAFETSTITAARRFKTISSKEPTTPSHFACVELKKQNNPAILPTKEKSAACNLISLMKNNEKDPLTPTLQYEDFAKEGYQDDANIEISPQRFFEATRKAVCEKKGADLEFLTTAMLAARISPCTSPIVQKHLSAKLFPEKK